MGRRRAHVDGSTWAGKGPPSDRERFEALYRDHARPLLAYALRRAARPEDAADVVAETMLVAWRRIDDVPGGDEARLWLYGVARRVLSNSRRGADRRDRLGERLRREVRRQADPDLAVGVTVRTDVRRALERLSADDRELLQLTSWEGLGPQQIATVLGVSSVVVRSRLKRARSRLRRVLGEEELGEDDDRPGPQPEPAGHVRHDEQPLVRETEDDR
jgi:RNA polymerase sigma factor (sigma-70 family)